MGIQARKRPGETVIESQGPPAKQQCARTLSAASADLAAAPARAEKLPRNESVGTFAPITPSSSGLDIERRFDTEKIVIVESGEKGTLDYRVHFEHKDTGTLSPWHDIPLHAGDQDQYNFLCEIPKWTRRKFEVSTIEVNNPIKQDEKKGVPREYKWGDMLFNYGMFPQTWEDPAVVSEETGCKGDGDPLDVVEIGSRQCKTGEVTAVKVLGVLAMIDDGETDWKVVTIRADDRLAPLLHDVDDVEREVPGCISALREWLRMYKVPDGKPQNSFGLEERCMPAAYAKNIIVETQALWAAKYGPKPLKVTQ